MTKSCTIMAPQGLGDIWWCYQKLYNHFDVINLNICVSDLRNQIELRCQKLFSNLDKIGQVNMVKTDRRKIADVSRGTFYLDRIIPDDQPDEMTFDYGVNRWLEKGLKLETIDRKFDVAWDIPVLGKPIKTFDDTPYIILYVSGDTRKLGQRVWPPEGWVQFITQFRNKLQVDWPVLMIGAGFDQWVVDRVTPLLTQNNIPWRVILDLEIEEIFYVLKNAEYFIGYQSGLNILANHMKTKQLIVYFDELYRMRDSWARPESRTDGTFNYVTFQEGITPALAKFERFYPKPVDNPV